MKRIYLFLLTALLCCLFVLPASASSLEFPDPTLESFYSSDDNYFVNFDRHSNSYVLYSYSGDWYYDDYQFFALSDGFLRVYTNDSGSWASVGELEHRANDLLLDIGPGLSNIVWSNSNILDKSGAIIFDSSVPIEPTECDGSTCPANDADHNNICDDCGKVLTYNLRSTLLDFTKNLAESYSSGYPYYAIMQNPDSDKYNLYFSKSPMTSPDYKTIVGSSMQLTITSTNDDGTFTNGIFGSVESFSGTLVYSNHEIENFQNPPLAVVIQGVAGEALEVELPNLMTEVRTIVVLAVGCLALLILSVVLVKALRRFSRS